MRSADLGALSLRSSSVVGGASVTATVTIANPPDMGDAIVGLGSNSLAATTPIAVAFFNPQTSATFTITTKPVALPQTVTISAQLGPMVKTVTLTLYPPLPKAEPVQLR